MKPRLPSNSEVWETEAQQAHSQSLMRPRTHFQELLPLSSSVLEPHVTSHPSSESQYISLYKDRGASWEMVTLREKGCEMSEGGPSIRVRSKDGETQQGYLMHSTIFC